MPLTPDSITNEDILNVYKDASVDIANMIGKLKLHVDHFEAIENITLDNGDPSFTAHEALEALGNALATIVTYADEYEKDPYVNPNLEKH